MRITDSISNAYNYYNSGAVGAKATAGATETSRFVGGQAKSNPITEEEKNFFSGLYPDKKETIMDYHYYQKSGKMAGVSVGSIIDRRG